MDFLYLLESIRNPVLDTFFSIITHLGSETLFLAIAIIIFWCVNKFTGYYLMTVGFFGTLVNQFLKIVCQIPRPWVKDPNFTIVEAEREYATGYSFPSGHTQSVTASLGCPARSSKNLWIRISCIALIILTALSRMYLGVHTPMDVGFSLVFGTALIFAFYPLFKKGEENPKLIYIAMGSLAVLSLIYALFVDLYPWAADIDKHNLESAIKNGYLLFGCGCGMTLSFYLERKYIKFETKAPLKTQILKIVFGLAAVLIIKAALKPILNPIFGGHQSADALRYFLLVMFAACVWPMTFNWFIGGCKMPKWVKRTIIIVLCVILFLVALAGYLFWDATRDTPDAPVSTNNASNTLITPLGKTMLSGHRAGGGIAPENTMAALKNCIENDVYDLDVFEFDIHLTADNIPVLIHDGTLDRTSDAVEYFGEEDVKVGNKTLSELKHLNMGAKFKNSRGEMPFADLSGDNVPDDLRITTLDEALTYLESNGNFHYIIEIKNSGEKGLLSTDILYNTLKKHGTLERTVVGTFNNEVTEYMDKKYPDMLRSAGFNECIEFFIYSMFNIPVSDDHFGYVALQIPTTDYTVNLGTSRVVNYAHKHNIAVQYWTINDPAEMARLQKIGADAIMTDVPDIAAEILRQP